MHFHAEHGLFFERRQPLWRAAASLALATAVLVANAGAGDFQVSLAGAGVGGVLLLVARVRGHNRLEPALAWALSLVVLALASGLLINVDQDNVWEAAARILCGVVWVLWLGTQLDWASLREVLVRLRVPDAIVSALDHALLHGILTQREWGRRRDAAQLRLGAQRLPLPVLGTVLGEGALHALVRLEQVEENTMLRSESTSLASAGDKVALDGVDVERGGRTVLSGLSLSVDGGEWLLLCGPSGAGKSSLLRLLAGLDGPSKGSLARLGRTITPSSALRARLDGRVALLSQNPAEHFIASTVQEDILWGLRRRGVAPTTSEQRLQDVAESLRIDHLLLRPCHQLSFGEQRRVALAGLLVLEPDLLLLDEPTAGLDPVAADELRALVGSAVARTGATCVWATHDLHTLPAQARRVVLLRDGAVVYDGDAATGLSEPWLFRAGLSSGAPPASADPEQEQEQEQEQPD